MAQTEIHEWPLPEPTATANVPQDMKNLADALDRQVPFVCTADTRPAPYAGLIIYETDTSRVLIGEGSRWQHISSNWKKFNPVFKGWQSLGTAPIQEGQYIIGSGGMVTFFARLKAGSGSVMGNGRLEMHGLPLKGASIDIQQFGTYSLLHSGPNGPLRVGQAALGTKAGVAVELFITNGASGVSSPGPAGIPWTAGSELHMSMTYLSELGNSVI